MTQNKYRSAFVVPLLAALLAAVSLTTRVSYQERVVEAVDTCRSQSTTRIYTGMRDCVGDLAAPNPAVRQEVDLWDVFLDCLAEFYRSLDDMYPSGSDVNDCLEKHGFDVGR